MYEHLLGGELVRLVPMDPETGSRLFSEWSRDSEYLRYLDSTPAKLVSKDSTSEWIAGHKGFLFIIRTLDDGKPIGFAELDGIAWKRTDAWIGIGIGDRNYWGKGYGADALRILMRYAFTELDLHRLSLSVFEYNRRAIRLYEKLGFRNEGRKRQFFQREGRRWDLVFMGMVKPEWEKLYEP